MSDDAANGERDTAEIALSGTEKLDLLWRIVQGDPTGESGRSTGIAQISRETYGMVGVVLRTLREQDAEIAKLVRGQLKLHDILQELMRRLPPPQLPAGVASTPPPKDET